MYLEKDKKKGKDEKTEKGKEKQVESEDSMSSFNSGKTEDMRTKFGEKIEVSKDTFKMMKNVQKTL